MDRIADTLKKCTRRRAALALSVGVALCAPALFAFHVGPPMGKRHENRKEIEQMEEAWRNAVLRSSSAAMSPLLADDYIAITPSGTLETKDMTLANLRAGVLHVTSIKLSEQRLRFYGDTALVTSRAEVRGTIANHDISGSYRYTHVYVRSPEGTWKMVSFEASRIRHARKHK